MTTLEFRFEEIEADTPRQTTRAFSVLLDQVVVWPAQGVNDATLEVQIDDFLSHLTEFWKPLMLRQTYPLALNPARPSQLRAKAEEHWAALPEQQVEEEDLILERFQDCHDLSRCFAGYFDLSSLWLIRSGEFMLIDTAERTAMVDYGIARDALQAAGNWIAERLKDDRWSDLIACWRDRDAGDGTRLLRWSTSLDEVTVESLAADGLLVRPGSVTDAANDNDELRLAARMASALPPEEVRAILERIAMFPKANAPQLDDLAGMVGIFMDVELASARPFEQGEAVAGFVRERFGITPEAAVDIFDLVRNLGVQIYPEPFDPPTLDALAVWGGRHGPAALLNIASQRHGGTSPGHAEDRGQVRVTLAHELCHFLIDRGHALGAVDVLRSRMPVAVEQRARAFAAEFLLPGQAAGSAWLQAERPRGRAGLESLLDELCRHFIVSKSVASWKLEHGARSYGVNLGQMLESIVPQR